MSYGLCLGQTVFVRSAGGESGSVKDTPCMSTAYQDANPLCYLIDHAFCSCGFHDFDYLLQQGVRRITVGGNCSVQHIGRRCDRYNYQCNALLLLLLVT